MSVSQRKRYRRSCHRYEQALLDRSPEAAREFVPNLPQSGDCETAAEVKVNQAFSKNPIKVLVEEKYGVDLDEITNPWHAAVSSFFAFSVGSLPPALAIMLFPEPYRIPVTVVVVALTLLLTGYISAKLGKAPIKQAMLRNLTVGLLTMLVTFLVGHIFHVNV